MGSRCGIAALHVLRTCRQLDVEGQVLASTEDGKRNHLPRLVHLDHGAQIVILVDGLPIDGGDDVFRAQPSLRCWRAGLDLHEHRCPRSIMTTTWITLRFDG
jgi:hypothetical protein